MPNVNKVFDFKKYSSFKKTLRVTAWIIGFIDNIKAKLHRNRLSLDPILKPTELKKTENILVKAIQHDFTCNPIDNTNRFRELDVRLDNDGILK